MKRIIVYSLSISSYLFTCNVDSNLNPYQDCFNAMSAICNPLKMKGSKEIKTCMNAVDQMTSAMNYYWQNVRKECGQWAWQGFVGNVSSTNCTAANQQLWNNTYYVTPLGTNIYVSEALTDSIIVGLWERTK